MQIKFFLNVNQKKKNEKSPDYWGYIKDENGEKRQRVSAWEGKNQNGRYISVIIDEIAPAQIEMGNMVVNEDDLPF